MALFRAIDRGAYSARFPTEMDSFPPIVIVDIDRESVSRLGGWPFDRKVFATAAQNALSSGAAVVAIDIVFASERSLDGDTLLAEIAKTTKSIVFAYEVRNSEPRLYGSLLMAGPAMGYIDVDVNGKDSEMTTFPEIAGETSLPWKIASIYCKQRQPQCKPRVRVSDTDMVYASSMHPGWGINFGVPVSAIPRVPFHRLAAGYVSGLKGKIAIISPSADSFNDQIFLPVENQKQPGSVALAYAVETVISGSSIFVLPRWVLVSLLSVANFGLFLLCRLYSRHRTVVVLAASAMFAIVQWATFTWLQLHLPLTIWVLNLALVWVAALWVVDLNEQECTN